MQNVFTSAKLGSLVGVIGVGLVAGWSATALRATFANLWTPRGYTAVAPGLSPETVFGLFVAICVAQVGSLFAADAWNNITFTAGEVRHPRRNVPLSLLLGTLLVIGLYVSVNFGYLAVLPLQQVQQAASDRVAGAMLAAVLPATGAALVALAIRISAFGCINGMLMSRGAGLLRHGQGWSVLSTRSGCESRPRSWYVTRHARAVGRRPGSDPNVRSDDARVWEPI